MGVLCPIASYGNGAKAAHDLDALVAEPNPAFDTATTKDARGCFRHAAMLYTETKIALIIQEQAVPIVRVDIVRLAF